MPDRQVEGLRGFLQQGAGRLSKRAREQELAALTDDEAERVEALLRPVLRSPGPIGLRRRSRATCWAVALDDPSQR